MKPQKILLLLLMVLPLGLHAQRPYFPFFQQEYFFGHHPSAKTEAMGRSDVALGGSPSSLYYNPAGIGTIENWQAMASTSGPYYLLGNSDYHFFSYARRINDKFVAALSLNNFAMGNSTFQVNIGNDRYEVASPLTNDLILSLTGEVAEGLHVGLNAHFFSWKLFDEVSAARTFYLDAGALYTLPLAENGRLQFGVGIVNALGAELEFSAPDGASSDNWFPIIGRYGAAWMNELENTPIPISYTLTAEVQDLFNSAFRTAFRLGGEAVINNLLAVRMGFLTQTEDDMGFQNNLARFNDVTYGFGLILPVSDFTKGKLPVAVRLDYFSLRNPPLVVSPTRRANKRGFSLVVISELTSNN